MPSEEYSLPLIQLLCVTQSSAPYAFRGLLSQDFLGGAVVKTPCSQCRRPGPGQGTRSHMHATAKESMCGN